MTPKNLLNIFLALALAGLLALAIYEPGKTPAPVAKKLTTLDAAAVQTISISQAGRAPILLKKQSGQWQMQAPMKMPANDGRIQQLLRVLQAKSIARYPMSGVDANQLQLDAPSLTLQLDDLLLRFGSTDALGGSRYVQVGNTVHLITDRYSHLARGAATEFVSPLLLPERGVIDALALPGLQLTQQNGHWRLDGHSGDAAAIQGLLAEWRHARAMRVSALDQSVAPPESTESIVVTLAPNDTESDSKQVLRFELVRSETEIILQRQDIGLQYHLPLAAGQRLLALSAADATPVP